MTSGLLVLSGCGNKPSDPATPDSPSTTATRSTPASGATGATGKIGATTTRIKCSPATVTLPPKADFAAVTGAGDFDVELPKRNIQGRVAVESSSSSLDISSAKRSRKSVELTARSGRFVLVKFRLKNTGKKSLVISDVTSRFVIQRASSVYGTPTRCPAALTYALAHKRAAPGETLKPGRSRRGVLVFVAPEGGSLTLLGLGTGKSLKLTA